METTLSKDEAIFFLEKVLGFEAPETKLSEDKVVFLNNLVRSYVEIIPFQNIQLLAQAYHGQNHYGLRLRKTCWLAVVEYASLLVYS